MNKIGNPFSQLLVSLTPDSFIGRHSDLELILYGVSYSEPRSFALHGIKTIGKTSLLKNLVHPQGARAKYPSALTEYGPGLSGSLEFIYLDFYHVEGAAVLPTLRDELLHSRNIGPLLEPDLVAEAETYTDKADAKKTLKDILRALRQNGMRWVICLDHFDKAFQSMDYEDEVFLRSLTNDQPFVITTDKALPELREDQLETSPLINILIPRNIGLLTHAEARELIEGPANETKPPFTVPEVEFLLKAAGRQPYLLTLACEFLFNLRAHYPEIPTLLEQEGHTQQQVMLKMEALPAVNELFLYFWGQLDEYEQNVLAGIAVEEAIDRDREQRAVKSLSQKALIDEDVQTGRYRIFSELFASYVRQQRQPRRTGQIEEIADDLAPLDKKLFDYLLAHPNQLCTFEELLQEVWGDPNTSRRGLEAAIHRLRTRIQDVEMTDWDYIQNVRGKGYQYTPKPT